MLSYNHYDIRIHIVQIQSITFHRIKGRRFEGSEFSRSEFFRFGGYEFSRYGVWGEGGSEFSRAELSRHPYFISDYNSTSGPNINQEG